MIKVKLFILFATIASAVAQALVDPTITFEAGTIVGRERATVKNVSYYSYEGIRYGKAPVGDLRFKAPLPAETLVGVYDAKQPGPACLQPVPGNIIGSEDCLLLNIYVPKSVTDNACGTPLRAVIVNIHGGGFASGSATTNKPDGLVEEGLIFIAIQYRLGVLGFLVLDTADVPGNAGLKDQSLALSWIKKHVSKFGGDPNNISIFGESAGAISVQLHQISPMSKGLMTKIMSISGASLCEFSIQQNPMNKTLQLAANLGENSNSPDFLKNRSSVDIIRAAQNVKTDIFGSIQEFVFGPVVERKNLPGVHFITKMPVEYYRSGKYNHVPCIISQASEEFAVFVLFTGTPLLKLLIDIPRVVIPNSWQTYLSASGIDKVYKVILNFFFGTTAIDLSDHDQLESAIKLMSDIYILIGTDKVVRELAKTSKASIFYSQFSFTGVINGPFITPLGIVGATHTDDIRFLCPSENPRVGENTPDGVTRRRLISYYRNLQCKGNPTPGPYSNLLPTKWLQVTKHTRRINYMEINGEVTPSINPNEYRMNFWRDTEARVIRGEFD